MSSTVLVATSVHWPDDTRIRERLIRSLEKDFRVLYACPSPGPTDRSGVEVIELEGGRLARNLRLARLTLTLDWDVLALHDPETVLLGLAARLLRRKPVVFDVHENVPALALTRSWVPSWFRRPLARALGLLMRVAEKALEVTLAEEGYAALFRRGHPVFPNFPDTGRYPALSPGGDGGAVFLGDGTRQRGADLAIEACRSNGTPLTFIGNPPSLEIPGAEDAGVELKGVLPNPMALALCARAAVGLSPIRDLPNYRDSQPTKILEYLALGLPVVASDLPGTRQLVDGLDAVFLFTPGDSSSLADSLSSAMGQDVRDRAQRQAPRIREIFAWPDEGVRQFYTSLLAD